MEIIGAAVPEPRPSEVLGRRFVRERDRDEFDEAVACIRDAGTKAQAALGLGSLAEGRRIVTRYVLAAVTLGGYDVLGAAQAVREAVATALGAIAYDEELRMQRAEEERLRQEERDREAQELTREAAAARSARRPNVDALMEAFGIAYTPADALVAAGYVTAEDVMAAGEGELTSLFGVGLGTVNRIRARRGERPYTRKEWELDERGGDAA